MKEQRVYWFDLAAQVGPDSGMQCDPQGDGMEYGLCFERSGVGGGDVRVLVRPGTSEETALRLLKKLRQYIKRQGFEHQQRAMAQEELCPRCGAGIQATHHPLCQHRDGTSTGLTDEEVKKAIGVLMAGDCLDPEEIPF